MLEIKLALDPGQDPPQWVDDLISSGCLTEVHKFSKFMHGCAVLFPDVAQEVPYWVDDVSLRQSLQNSASRETGAAVARNNSRRVKPQPPPANGAPNGALNGALRPNENLDGDLTHPLLVGASSDTVLDLMGDTRQNADVTDGDEIDRHGGGEESRDDPARSERWFQIFAKKVWSRQRRERTTESPTAAQNCADAYRAQDVLR